LLVCKERLRSWAHKPLIELTFTLDQPPALIIASTGVFCTKRVSHHIDRRRPVFPNLPGCLVRNRHKGGCVVNKESRRRKSHFHATDDPDTCASTETVTGRTSPLPGWRGFFEERFAAVEDRGRNMATEAPSRAKTEAVARQFKRQRGKRLRLFHPPHPYQADANQSQEKGMEKQPS